MTESSYWDREFAEYYDSIMDCIGHTNLELDFWLAAAKRYGDPILEMGCGTGRILLKLAEAGFTVTGLDFSPPMLEVLRRKLESKAPEVRERVDYLLSDMVVPGIRTRRFRTICFGASQFLHLRDDDERLTCLKHSRDMLLDDGVIVIANSRLMYDETQRTRPIEALLTDSVLEVTRRVSGNSFETTFRLISKSNGRKDMIFKWNLCKVERSHMESLISEAGLESIPPDSELTVPTNKPKDFYVCRARSA